MPAVIRLGDLSQGHGCFPASQLTETHIQKTFVNKIKPGCISNAGSKYIIHCCGPDCHPTSDRFPSSGASKTYLEGILAARIGDPINCGDICAEGSYNTFIE